MTLSMTLINKSGDTFRTLTIYNVCFFRAVMADNINRHGEAAPKETNFENFMFYFDVHTQLCFMK